MATAKQTQAKKTVKSVKSAKTKRPASKKPAKVTEQKTTIWQKLPVWQWVLIGLGGVLVLVAIGVVIWRLVVPKKLIQFDHATEETATKLDDGAWRYTGTVERECKLDQAVLSVDTITTPTEKVETLVCETDPIEGRYDTASGGRVTIQYPAIDKQMIVRNELWQITHTDKLTEKTRMEEYTEDLVNWDGKISFRRGIERITEEGKADTYVPSEDTKTGLQAAREEINGGEGFSYEYTFRLQDEEGRTRATYVLTVKVKLGDDDRQKLENLRKRAEEKRQQVRAEWDAAPEVSYRDLVDNFSKYKGQLVKVKGKVTQLSSSGKVCSVEAAKETTQIELLGQMINMDKFGDVIVKNCVYENGDKTKEGDIVTATGKVIEQRDGMWKDMPMVRIDAVEVEQN